MLLPLHSTSRVCRRTYGIRGTAALIRGLCGLFGLLVIATPRADAGPAAAAAPAATAGISATAAPVATAGPVVNTGPLVNAAQGASAAANVHSVVSTLYLTFSQQPPANTSGKPEARPAADPDTGKEGDATDPQSDKSKPAGSAQNTKNKTPPITVSRNVDLLARSLPETWTMFSSREETRLGDVWKVVESNGEKLLICTGTPKGFLLTKRQYQNFELSFEWKYVSDPNGNSGVLAFTKNEPRLWPTSLQVQLHQPSAGSIFPSGDATSDSAKEATGLALEIGKWNKCRVVARNGKVSVEINGKQAGEVSGCKPYQGSIALQSEGSETHFRRMIIRELPEQAPSIADETSTSLPQPDADSPGGSVETDG